MLQRLRRSDVADVTIYESDLSRGEEVDTKLVKVASELGGRIVTTDFNLNKIAQLQDVPVLNVNDLANALRPVVIPGEELHIELIKPGEEHGQAVGYLDDGTMVVVESAKDMIGKAVAISVTSVIQTSAGRMVFGKPAG